MSELLANDQLSIFRLPGKLPYESVSIPLYPVRGMSGMSTDDDHDDDDDDG